MNVIITSITDDGAGIRIFELAGAGGAPLPPYAPGAHIDVTLGNGLVRQYSLCCRQPSPAAYRIAVKREPASRGGSAWLHETAATGDILQIGAPRNAFGLATGAGPHLLLAGGIGITPLLSMAHALARRDEDFRLACFARDAASLAFRHELQDPILRAHVSLHAGLDAPQTAAAIAALLSGFANAQVYTCGPAPFMASVAQQATARFGAARFHQESFNAPQPSAGDAPFLLRLKDGREIAVAADRSALSCLQEAGVDVPCSCEVGVCGTCQTALLAGQADHRDSFLSEEEKASGKWFMPCVSRAKSAVLEIDL
ncbi:MULTISPECIES: PDR/VanB family oxidoreductase [unclassified Herbaspirillum]|uniref:PDR/VanB family oxidoreductase n=1 Tax=unclassified Herbaspirillum TaxID=2624150 RepID=UPI00114ED20D|nr:MULTISPECIES: PDR/VanB family oxidoreductase [unclassified Herbaspirillum]MBB5392316.1 vanillate O-demethylase ferredoxin subunit [Herbaspirillum sp. SJZ102]TQK05957.1 vanillate O-demethylase ferredoxin subunit [Herbaspirillum sp. SJZ130]TQK12565.1 vanillate O-demethylase ferredoxin subunit [Herbaspirillum sp. SJZ106]